MKHILAHSIAAILLGASSIAQTTAEPAATPDAKPKTAAAPATPAKAAPAKPKQPGTPARPPQAAKAPRKAEDAVTPAVKDPVRHERFLERVKQGDIDLVFLGDSITDGWPRNGEKTWLKFAPYNPANFGISGDRTEHVLWRITNGELDGINPKGVVIMIGTNNIGQNADEKPEWAATGVKKIVDTVREKLPNAQILLLGVFPRGTADSAQRKAVNEINEIISQYGDGKTVRYLDIGKVFLDENGEIPADVMPDRLHPNAKGYELWYNAIKQPVADLMKPASTGGKGKASKAPAKKRKKK